MKCSARGCVNEAEWESTLCPMCGYRLTVLTGNLKRRPVARVVKRFTAVGPAIIWVLIALALSLCFYPK